MAHTLFAHNVSRAAQAAAFVLASLTCALPSASVHAQVMDELDVRRESADAVVRVHFTKAVRLQRSTTSRDGDVTLVQYETVGAGEANVIQPSVDRRVDATADMPQITVTDEANGARLTDRKLVVRVAPAAKVRVRAGRDGRSIEIVLVGLGAKVAPALPITQTATTPPVTGYQVRLQSSSDPTMQLLASVPKEVQNDGLNTARRMDGGVVVYEFLLGPYDTQAEAERALALVKPRFATATLVVPASRASAATAEPLPAAVLAARAAAAAAAAATAAASPNPAASMAADPNVMGVNLLASAKEAYAKGNVPVAIDALSKVLDLPPNAASREAQALSGQWWLQQGDTERARREFELFVKLYPSGADTDRVTAQLKALPAAPTAAQVAEQASGRKATPTTTTINGSIGVYYYGGNSKVRSEEFKDSPIAGLPELVQNPTLAGTDQKLVLTSADLNYRYRSAEEDLRFVFRDTLQSNLLAGKGSRNRLSAAYVDYRLLTQGASVRLGRQSPLGGGVMNRFDGMAVGYTLKPKWRINAVAGRPTDRLQQTKRYFYGTSIDADALTEHLGGTAYVNEQKIDGQTDRRAVGLDMRYFDAGLFVSTNFDYDVKLRAVNIAAIQGTWQQLDSDGNMGTTVNLMLDRRAQPLLTLGNALFFQDPNGTIIPVRLSDALALRDIETLRNNVRNTTAYSTQGVLGVTTPLNKHWQAGGDVRLTKIDAIAPVADILPLGQAATGNIWGFGGQLIGSNLYSERDTHVFSTSLQRAPTFNGVLAMYNNVSAVGDGWQVEPSFQIYRQTSLDGMKLSRLKPGVRVTWRVNPSAVLESALDYEVTSITTPIRNEKSNRVFYYLGGRYEF